VPQSYESDEGVKLGSWVSESRKAYSKGKLSEERAKRLEELGFVWDTKGIAWEANFGLLAQYLSEKGDCLVPSSYKTVEGTKLGLWVSNLRRAYSKGQLSEERARRLEELGFMREPRDAAWEANFGLLVQYHSEKGDCLVPISYETAEGVKLGTWVYNQRQTFSKGQLNKERAKRLEELGFVWDPRDAAWEANFDLLVQYHSEKGDFLVPADYESTGGVKLGGWVGNQRRAYLKGQLSEERTKQLEEHGFVWDNIVDAAWEANLGLLARYRSEKGDCFVPRSYETVEGAKLGRWIHTQRQVYSKGQLSEERAKRLEELGFVWDPMGEVWEANFDLLARYRTEMGDCFVPRSYETADGAKLGIWIITQRHAFSKGQLSKERAKRLEKLGFVWDPMGAAWEANFELLVQYHSEKGNCLVPADYETAEGVKLGGWVRNQRRAYSKGQLSEERTKQLEEHGFVWRQRQ